MGKIIQIIVHINDASKGRIVSFFAMVSPNLGHTLHFFLCARCETMDKIIQIRI